MMYNLAENKSEGSEDYKKKDNYCRLTPYAVKWQNISNSWEENQFSDGNVTAATAEDRRTIYQ